jgi:hypothetical protein
MAQKEFPEDYFSIGNTTNEEVFLKYLEDGIYSALKKELKTMYGNSEEKARNAIRDNIFNTEKGRKELELKRKKYQYRQGMGHDGLWVVNVDAVIREKVKKIYNLLKKSENYKLSSSNWEDVFASIFMNEINSVVAEEVTHAESDYRHEDKIDIGRDNFFFDFISLKPIEALKKEKKS